MIITAYATPVFPNNLIKRLVASAEAKILTRLLPNKIAPIKDSFLFNYSIATLALVFPFILRPVSLLLVLAVNAVSDPEKNAERTSRIMIAINKTIISKNIILFVIV